MKNRLYSVVIELEQLNIAIYSGLAMLLLLYHITLLPSLDYT